MISIPNRKNTIRTAVRPVEFAWIIIQSRILRVRSFIPVAKLRREAGRTGIGISCEAGAVFSRSALAQSERYGQDENPIGEHFVPADQHALLFADTGVGRARIAIRPRVPILGTRRSGPPILSVRRSHPNWIRTVLTRRP